MNTAKRKLEGKIAVITGGNSGIGRATAQLFNQEGARIALIGRDQKSIDETLAELSGKHLGFKGDVTSEKDLNGFFDQVRSRFGKIDILFINAGIAEQSMIAGTSPEFYDRHFNINVRGAFFAVQKGLPHEEHGPHEKNGRTARGCEGRIVHGFGRLVLHHRRRADGRRWDDAG